MKNLPEIPQEVANEIKLRCTLLGEAFALIRDGRYEFVSPQEVTIEYSKEETVYRIKNADKEGRFKGPTISLEEYESIKAIEALIRDYGVQFKATNECESIIVHIRDGLKYE